MQKQLLSVAAAFVVATMFIACSSNGVSSGDVNGLVNGPNSIKGTISGTMLNDTAYTFPFDYHVTTNDGNSAAESWIDSSTGDTTYYVWQYFYFDRNGYDDYGDEWSASGQYLNVEFEFTAKTVKKVTTLNWVPISTYPYQRVNGMWQNITEKGNRFVYGTMRYYGWYSYSVPPTMDISNLKYDNGSQILTGKLTLTLGNNNDVQVNSGNHNATTITGEFKIYIPKETFQLTKKSDNDGMIYRHK